MAQKAQLIDVMLGDGSFFCQLIYPGKPFPKLIMGKVVLKYDEIDMRKYALEKRPSLSGKKFNVYLTNQRVY